MKTTRTTSAAPPVISTLSDEGERLLLVDEAVHEVELEVSRDAARQGRADHHPGRGVAREIHRLPRLRGPRFDRRAHLGRDDGLEVRRGRDRRDHLRRPARLTKQQHAAVLAADRVEVGDEVVDESLEVSRGAGRRRRHLRLRVRGVARALGEDALHLRVDEPVANLRRDHGGEDAATDARPTTPVETTTRSAIERRHRDHTRPNVPATTARIARAAPRARGSGSRRRAARLIAEPAHGEHDLGILRVLLDLRPQPLDVDVDQRLSAWCRYPQTFSSSTSRVKT